MMIQILSAFKALIGPLAARNAVNTALLLSAAIVFCACTSLSGNSVQPGDSEAEVLAKLGNPTHRYQNGNEQLLEYRHGPWGQTTYMARLGPNRKLISYEQVLTNERFANISVGKASKDQVLRQVGSPSATSYLALKDLEVWSYPYRENGVWNSVMHVHFDRNGIVHSTVLRIVRIYALTGMVAGRLA